MHSRGVLAPLLALGLLVAGCSEATDSLRDLGRVRATFYKYQLAPDSSHLDMPGERLAPAVGCKEGKTTEGLFDPCKPDPNPPELDAYGLPRVLPAPKAGRETAQPTLPTTKPAAVSPPVRAKPGSTKPGSAKAAAVAKPVKKPVPPKTASRPPRR